MYPQIIADINIQCLDDRRPELKIHISELILDTYEYIPASYITMRCII